MGDGLDSFDGFTRKAAAAGMFNDDQVGHMRYLSSLPPESKCGCGWFEKWDCWDCNRKELVGRGGRIDGRTGNRAEYTLPDGRTVDYTGLCRWLRDEADKEAAGLAEYENETRDYDSVKRDVIRSFDPEADLA